MRLPEGPILRAPDVRRPSLVKVVSEDTPANEPSKPEPSDDIEERVQSMRNEGAL